MAAPIGNEFWRLRSSHGRSLIFETPEDLWEKAVEYFEWNNANPLYINQVSVGEILEVPKARPMSLEGLYDHLDISSETFLLYEQRKDFVAITRAIRNVIFRQQYEGAASGIYNANIVARKLGLVEKTQSDITSGGATLNIFKTRADKKSDE